MSSPTVPVTKRLYALSSNRCAFPKCSLALVDPGGKVTGRICHIKARKSGGPRYDPNQTDKERNSFENLLLLCPIHHDVVDSDEESYSVDRLVSMKAAHEASAQPVEPLADAAAADFISLSNLNIVAGSVVTSTGQTGGQVANMIANYLGPEPIGQGEWSAKLREKEADVLTEVWNEFHEAFGAVWDATSPMQQVARVERMSSKELEEFLTGTDIPESQKDELRDSTDRGVSYKKIDFTRRYARAQSKRIAFHNFLVKNRILLFDELKELLTTANTSLIDALIKLEIGSEDEDLSWRVQAFRVVQGVEALVPRIEKLIHDRLQG